MKKPLFSTAVAIALLAAGCGSQPTAIEPVSQGAKTANPSPAAEQTNPSNIKPMGQSSDLKTELETVYGKVRAALAKKDQAAYEALTEPAKPGAKIPPEFWGDAVAMLVEATPDLSTTKYLGVEQKGDYAYYFVQGNLDDANFITLDVLKFHKTADGWKLSGQKTGSSFPKKGAAADETAIAEKLNELKAGIK